MKASTGFFMHDTIEYLLRYLQYTTQILWNLLRFFATSTKILTFVSRTSSVKSPFSCLMRVEFLSSVHSNNIILINLQSIEHGSLEYLIKLSSRDDEGDTPSKLINNPLQCFSTSTMATTFRITLFIHISSNFSYQPLLPNPHEYHKVLFLHV